MWQRALKALAAWAEYFLHVYKVTGVNFRYLPQGPGAFPGLEEMHISFSEMRYIHHPFFIRICLYSFTSWSGLAAEESSRDLASAPEVMVPP